MDCILEYKNEKTQRLLGFFTQTLQLKSNLSLDDQRAYARFQSIAFYEFGY
ncbi:MAG: hypothetical protein ACI9O6_000493 [Glaciecola sp.]|jgi:hypothetical protein